MYTKPKPSPPQIRRLGVLGGMGPLATVDFLHKVVACTAAVRDQDHVPMVVEFCPQIPDRVKALLEQGRSPLGDLIAAAQALERSGADGLVMPCNTAHAWYDSIVEAINIPMLHIVDVVLSEAQETRACDAIGLLATSGTLKCGIYQTRDQGLTWITSTEQEQERWVTPGIAAIKSRRLSEGAASLRLAAQALTNRGAKVIVLGCTEIPLGLLQRDVNVSLIDSSLALARASVAWAGRPLCFEESTPLAQALGQHKTPSMDTK